MPAIVAALEAGAGLEGAARAGGVGLATLLRWCEADDGVVRGMVEGAQRKAHGQKDEGPDRGGSGPSSAHCGLPGASFAGSAPEVLRLAPHDPASGVRRASDASSTMGRDRWARPREEAAALGPGLFGWLLWLEARIGAHNARAPAWECLPAMPAPLLDIFGKFWASGKQELLVRGGRGLGKSTMFLRAILVDAFFGPRVVNGGEIAIFPELSTDMDEANLKVSGYAALLKILGLQHDPTRREDAGEEGTFRVLTAQRGRSRIQLVNAEREHLEFRVYPATVAAMSGPTLKGMRADEEAKWKHSSSEGTNSAEEVLDAARPAFRGRPHAHLYRVSSAYLAKGSHFEDVEEGDTPTRMVARIGEYLTLARDGFEARALVSSPADAAEIRAYAATLTPDSPNLPSWFNPSLDPRTLAARNVRVWLREYGSLSTGGDEDGDFFDPLTLDAAEQAPVPAGLPDSVCAAIDTGATKNPAALAIVGRWNTGQGPRFAPLLLRSWKPAPGRPLDLRLVVLPEMARATKLAGASGWSSDGFASDQVMLVAAGAGLSVAFVATSEAHRDVYAPVRDGLGRGEVCLRGCEGASEVAAQLRRVSSVAELGASGARVRMVVPEDAGGEHGDLGVALVRALASAGCGRVEIVDSDAWDRCEVLGRYGSEAPTMAERFAGR